MLKNYFIVAWRNLFRSKSSSLINIGGLAAGMAVALLIGLWINDELSFNHYHTHYQHIAKVLQTQSANGRRDVDQSMSFPIGPGLRAHYGGDFKYVVMSSVENQHILTVGDSKLSMGGLFMDKDAPAMLSLRMQEGSFDALKDPHSILLSASTAKALFGHTDPLGKNLQIDNQLDVRVTGVYDDLPYNSEFRSVTFIAPWDLYVASADWIRNSVNKWDNNSFHLFVQLNDHADIDVVNRKIAGFKQANVAPEDKKLNTVLFLFPMADWHLRSHWEDGRQTGGLIEYVRLFGTIGIFVLLLACINFMNLSTARSERRAKEVGIRKSIGSLRSQLIGQFYSESLLVVILAFGLSLGLVQIILPWFDLVADKNLTMPWTNPVFWLLGLAFTAITAIIAGSYPALYLSSFRPVKVLKGAFKVGRLAAIPRKTLVVLQFTISITLIIGTIVVYRQILFSRDRPIGYDRDRLMMITMKSHDYYGKFDVLRDELKKTGAIAEMAESSSPMTEVWATNDGFEWPGYDPNVDADFGTIWVTHEFGKTVGWTISQGRDFSRELGFRTDSASIIVNEAAVKFMGLKDPVGTMVRWANGGNRRFTIIGVAKNMLMESPYDNVRPTFYFMDYENANWMLFRLNPNSSAHESVAKIAATFKHILPAVPFDYLFADNEYTAKFAAEERIGKLAIFFTVLAVFISCIGLFGLASFVAEQRTREIGIRKVLGASVTNLWGLLSKDFIQLVGIACIVSVPVAWYVMHGWLQNYTYRASITWWIFAVTGCGALLLTLVTVSWQAIRTALANPVESLRAE
jgi:putative ABC transport system permease protein